MFRYTIKILLINLISLGLSSQIVNASNLENGKKLFQANCIVCHQNGNNIIIPEINLQKDVLEQNGINTMDALIYQITNGKNGMPAFGGRLRDLEIEELAIYVLQNNFN